MINNTRVRNSDLFVEMPLLSPLDILFYLTIKAIRWTESHCHGLNGVCVH